MSSFQFEISDPGVRDAKHLTLTDSNGTITIYNWMSESKTQTSFDGITFADGKMTFEQIKQKAGW